MSLEFMEEQRFRQWWLWAILGAVSLVFIWALYQQIILGKPFGDTPMPDLALGLTSFLVFSSLGLFWMITLKTEIDQEELRIRFFPFVNRTILWRDVKSAEVIHYGFVGGWGIRWFTKYGTVYNTQGNIGLAIQLKNGKKLLVGTDKEMELEKVIQLIKLG
jgi:hypothetical protein